LRPLANFCGGASVTTPPAAPGDELAGLGANVLFAGATEEADGWLTVPAGGGVILRVNAKSVAGDMLATGSLEGKEGLAGVVASGLRLLFSPDTSVRPNLIDFTVPTAPPVAADGHIKAPFTAQMGHSCGKTSRAAIAVVNRAAAPRTVKLDAAVRFSGPTCDSAWSTEPLRFSPRKGDGVTVVDQATVTLDAGAEAAFSVELPGNMPASGQIYGSLAFDGAPGDVSASGQLVSDVMSNKTEVMVASFAVYEGGARQ
jgi:hypothetical protein